MKRKFVLGITAILCVSVCLLTPSLFNISEEDEALYNAYKKQTFHNNFITSTSIVELVENEQNSASEESPENTNESFDSSLPGISTAFGWIDILDSVHKAWGGAGATYVYGGNHSMTLWGESVNVRWDCSGYIGYCLYKLGCTTSTTSVTSSSGWGSNGSANATKYGFTYLEPSNGIDIYTQLQQGDLLFYDGHVEAFYEYNGNQSNSKPIVYNWGGKKSTSDKYHDESGNLLSQEAIGNVISYGTSGHDLGSIMSVWRMN